LPGPAPGGGAELDQADSVDPALHLTAQNLTVEADRAVDIGDPQDHMVQSLDFDGH
jgi:hypothetical protein